MYQDHFRNSPGVVELAEKAARAQLIFGDAIGAFKSIYAEVLEKYRQLDRKSDPVCSLSQAAQAHPPEYSTIQQRLVSFINERPDLKKESLRTEAKLHFSPEKVTDRMFNPAFSEVKGYGVGRPRKRAR